MASWIWDVIEIAGSAYNSYKQAEDIKSAGSAESEEIKRVAEANAEISRYDADVIDKMVKETAYATGVELLTATRTMNQQMKLLKSTAAKSGIALLGTVKDVEKYSKQNFIADLEMIKYNGKKAEEKQKDLANRYRKLADKGLRDSAIWASNVLESSNSKANTSIMLGITNVLSKAYEAYEEYQDTK